MSWSFIARSRGLFVLIFQSCFAHCSSELELMSCCRPLSEMRDSHLHCHPSERGGEASIFHDLACTPGDLLLHLQQKKKQQVPRVANQSASNACCVAAAAPG